MSQSVQSTQDPQATPVGHSGTRVVIRERTAWSLSGWFGVIVIAICIGVCFPLAHSSIKGVLAVPILVAVLIAGLVGHRAAG